MRRETRLSVHSFSTGDLQAQRASTSATRSASRRWPTRCAVARRGPARLLRRRHRAADAAARAPAGGQRGPGRGRDARRSPSVARRRRLPPTRADPPASSRARPPQRRASASRTSSWSSSPRPTSSARRGGARRERVSVSQLLQEPERAQAGGLRRPPRPRRRHLPRPAPPAGGRHRGRLSAPRVRRRRPPLPAGRPHQPGAEVRRRRTAPCRRSTSSAAAAGRR